MSDKHIAPQSNTPENRRILLIYPNTGLDIPKVSVFMPLSVIYLAESLKEAGFAASIIDLRTDTDWQKTLRREMSLKPLYVGISAMTGKQIHWGLKAARQIRQCDPSVPIVWGGTHASVLPEETLADPFVDTVVTGKGEQTVVQLAREVLNNGRDTIIGRIYRTPLGKAGVRGGKAFDLQGIPWHDYVTPIVHDVRGLAYVSSRGCPHRCAYCYNRAVNKSIWCGETADSVLNYLRNLARHDVRGVIFFDDNFFVNRERVKEIALGIIKEKINIAIKADCRADYLVNYDEDFLLLLKEAGFELLYIGAESGSDRVLELMRKDVDLAAMLEANRRLAKVGIRPHYSFMAGVPGESIEDMYATIQLMVRLKEENPQAYMSPVKIYVPYPGTALFETAVEMGFEAPESLADWSKVNWGSRGRPWLNREQTLFVEKMSYVSLGLDPSVIDLSGMSKNRFAIWGFNKFVELCRKRCRKPGLGMMPELPLVRVAKRIFHT